MTRHLAAAPFLLEMSWPAVAGVDKPWQELDSSSGGDSLVVGLVLFALAYGAWRLFVSGDLGTLIASVIRFLLIIYLPVALFLAVAVLASLGLQAAGIEKGTAGFLALLSAAGVAWVVVHIGLSRRADKDRRPAVRGDADD